MVYLSNTMTTCLHKINRPLSVIAMCKLSKLIFIQQHLADQINEFRKGALLKSLISGRIPVYTENDHRLACNEPKSPEFTIHLFYRNGLSSNSILSMYGPPIKPPGSQAGHSLLLQDSILKMSIFVWDPHPFHVF